MVYAELPELPAHLWQAAFFMELIARRVEIGKRIGDEDRRVELIYQANIIEPFCHMCELFRHATGMMEQSAHGCK